ncbi:hypothetical protein AAG906_004105 [Vitis piasezkii]
MYLGFQYSFQDWKWLNTITGLNRRLRKNLEELIAVCNEIIEEHVNEKKEREDFVDVLLRVQKRKDLEVAITDDNLKALDMFVAGTDTTSSTLEWTMTELARHPHVMKKAQQEVRNIASGEGKVEETHLHQLHYMKAGQDTGFLPFGGGRRGCPSYSFGLATVEIALARLLYHFDWELPHGVEADDMDLNEIFGLATRKNSALILVPRYNRDYEMKKNDT